MWRPIRNLACAVLVVLAAAPAAAQTSADDLAARTTETLYRLAHLFEPPAQSITIPNTFVNGTVADATQVNANFTALSSNALNRNGGTMLGTLNSRAVTPTSDATYDLGTNVLRFRDLWMSRNLAVGGTTTFNSLAYTWPASQTANYFLQTNGSGTLAWAAPAPARGCDVRLTLTSGTAVTTADVTGAATVYATPYVAQGGGPASCAFYDGSAAWTAIPVTEVSIALGTLTAGLPYDVYCYNNSGAMGCDAPVAWTNGTTRATALALQNGVYVKTGTTTRRYIGSFYTTSTTTTEDSATKGDVCNYYNRVPRLLTKADATASWTYVTTATVRQVRATATNQVEFLQCVAEYPVTASYFDLAQTNDASLRAIKIGLGLDSTTAFSASQSGNTLVTTSALQNGTTALFQASPAVGYHYLAMLEAGDAAVTVTFYGTGTYAGTATLLAVTQH